MLQLDRIGRERAAKLHAGFSTRSRRFPPKATLFPLSFTGHAILPVSNLLFVPGITCFLRIIRN